MIPLNSRQFLPARAFWYLALRALVGAAVFVSFGRFAHFLANSPVGRCSGVLCGNSNSGLIGWILYLLAGIMIVNSILKFRWFSFTLTDHTINIDSGVFVQSSRVVRFDKIQDVEARRDLLHMLLGLKSVAIWTASLDQVRGNTRRPDGLIVLEADTADWLANFLSHPDRSRALPDDGGGGGMQATGRSRPGNFGAVIGYISVVLVAAIAWGLWSKPRGAHSATIAAPAAPALSERAAVSAPPSAPATAATPALAAAPSPNSQPPLQTYAANMTADPVDYTIACSMVAGGTHGVPTCDSMKWGQRCERENEFRSTPTSESTRLVIANRSDQTLKFYWLDASGQRTPYAVLAPGRKIGQPSHIGAHWLVATDDGRCVGIFNADTARIGIF